LLVVLKNTLTIHGPMNVKSIPALSIHILLLLLLLLLFYICH